MQTLLHYGLGFCVLALEIYVWPGPFEKLLGTGKSYWYSFVYDAPSIGVNTILIKFTKYFAKLLVFLMFKYVY